MKQKQLNEMHQLLEKIPTKFYKELKWSKRIVELKKQEQILFSVKDYKGAEKVRFQIQKLKDVEIENLQGDLKVKILKEETVLRNKH